MKFIVFTLLLIALTAEARYYPVGKPDANTSYSSKDVCEERESFTCWDIRGKDLRYYEPGTEDVDDYSRPIYEAESLVQVCTDPDSCAALLEIDYCETNGLTANHFQVIAEDYSRVYCTQLLGYEQMTIPALVINQALKAQADAADAAAAAEKASRAAKREARLTVLEACATNPAPNDQTISNCIRDLAKEIVRDRLDESEL